MYSDASCGGWSADYVKEDRRTCNQSTCAEKPYQASTEFYVELYILESRGLLRHRGRQELRFPMTS